MEGREGDGTGRRFERRKGKRTGRRLGRRKGKGSGRRLERAGDDDGAESVQSRGTVVGDRKIVAWSGLRRSLGLAERICLVHGLHEICRHYSGQLAKPGVFPCSLIFGGG